AIQRFAKTPDEINALIGLVDRIYQRRCAVPSEANQPVVLIIDEFMDLMIRQQLTAAAVEALLALSGVGRKKLVFVVLISQNWGVNLLGRAGVAIRQNTTHALVCRSSEETAKFLLPSSYAPQAMMLQPGQCLFFGGGTPVLT